MLQIIKHSTGNQTQFHLIEINKYTVILLKVLTLYRLN